jgi:broad specificity phosphatase PhoE
MTARITLVCAAPTAANRAFAFPNDEPAEPKALAKMARLAGRLPHAGRIVASPALAARQTAEALGLTATIDPRLADCDYGRWKGRNLDTLQADEPDAVAEWLQNADAAPHGGESIVDLITRAAGFLTGLDAGASPVLAITHSAFIRAAIVHALGAPAGAFWRIDVAPLSLTRLSGAQGRWNLTSLEDLELRPGDGLRP